MPAMYGGEGSGRGPGQETSEEVLDSREEEEIIPRKKDDKNGNKKNKK